MTLKIGIACDHAGYELKNQLIDCLKNKVDFIDYGCDSPSKSVDYPDYAKKLCNNFNQDHLDYGILICGSGIGMSIAANRFSHIRAALVFDNDMARLSREHNDSNVLCLGARFCDFDKVKNIVDVFLNSFFVKERHEIRVKKI